MVGRIVQCPRTRSVPVDVSGWGVRGQRVRGARHRPQLRAPLLSAGAPPTWLQTFLPVPRAAARSSSPPELGGGAGSPPLFLLGSVEPGREERAGHPWGAGEGEREARARGPGRGRRRGGEGREGERRGQPPWPPRSSESVCESERDVSAGQRDSPGPGSQIRPPFASCPGAGGPALESRGEKVTRPCPGPGSKTPS